MDIIQNKRLRKLIFNKLIDDLSNVIYHPHGQDIWFIDFETKEWFFQYTCNSQLWFNQMFFNNYFAVFSLSTSDAQRLLRIWFETVIKLPVNVITRKNSNMDYYIDGIMRSNNYKWSINNRFGFSFRTVKQYIDIKSHVFEENVKLKHFLTDYELL